MGVDKSTVRRRIARLENDGLLPREARFGENGRQEANFYYFDGLVREATPFAEEALVAREQRQKQDRKRRLRKKPNLELLTNKDGETP